MPQEKDLLKELRIDRSSSNSAKRASWIWLLLALPLLLLAFGGWWWLDGAGAPAVRTAVVEENSSSAPAAVLNASGYVTARRRATVSSKVTGKVVEVLVEEGMRVRSGQILARLDDSTAEVNLKLADAQLEAAKRSLEEVRVRLEEAKVNLRRTRQLVAEGVFSQAVLDSDQAEVDSLEARLSLGKEEVAVAERQVAVRQRDVEDTIIRAPFSGVAISKDAQPGEMISPVSAGGGFTRTGICTIVDMSSLEIEVDVNESYITRVQPDQEVEAVLDAYPDWRIPARVITTIPSADRQKATVRVRIAFDQLDPRILPDMGVKVAFLEAAGEASPTAGRRMLVPRAAIRREGEQDVVYVVRQGHVERRAVRLGAAEGDPAEVLAGLSAGERVVVEGPADLADGDRIVVR